MHAQESVEFTAGEVHCYFPEWADRPPSAGTGSESHQNSYMAGGYAEEFGYFSSVVYPAVFPILDGDPERSSLWHVQTGGLHPGYPECARPLDRFHSEAKLATMPARPFSQPTEVRFAAVPVRRDQRPAALYARSWWRAWRILRRGMNNTI